MFRSRLVYVMIGIVSMLLVTSNAPMASAAPQDDQRLTAAQQVEADQVQAILDHGFDGTGAFDRAAALEVAPASVVDDFQTGYQQGPITAKACKGTSKVSSHWYGIRGDINSCVASKIVSAGTTFSVVAGLLAALWNLDKTSKSVVSITTAIVAAGTLAMTNCSSAGKGVRVYWLSTATNIPWCKSQ